MFADHEDRYIEKHSFKAGFVGSRDYTHKGHVRSVMKTLDRKYKNLVVVSGGCKEGADAIAKDEALGLGIPYREFTPEFREPTIYTVQDKSKFGKQYNASLYHKRNYELAKYCDFIVAFISAEYISDSDKASGTKSTLEKADNLGVKYTVIK